MNASRSHRHVPLLVPGALALLAGLWTGLARLGVTLPPPPAALSALHGPLMIAGFLGTLIGLERAIALRVHGAGAWPLLAPALCGVGALAMLAGAPHALAAGLVAAGAAAHVAIGAEIVRRARDAAHVVMGLGGVALLAGAAMWLAGWPLHRATPWWVAFLVLTIAGERLELARLVQRGPGARMSFIGIVALLVFGLVLGLGSFEAGLVVVGVAFALLGAWLLGFDLARRTIRTKGVTRYMAACLLPGYAWLVVAGALWIASPRMFLAGPGYDAMLHVVVVGFAFSMIFGHAPVILPAVTGAPMVYRTRFYAHLALLHLSLALRVSGDLLPDAGMRHWGGSLNVAAILLFLASTAAAAIGETRRRARVRAPVR